MYFHTFVGWLVLFSAPHILAIAAFESTTSDPRHETAISTRDVLKTRYDRPHSLGDTYTFDPRDGWQTVNVSDIQSKYPTKHPRSFGFKRPHGNIPGSVRKTNTSSSITNRENTISHHKNMKPKTSIGGTVKHVIQNVWKGMTAEGEAEPVVITWYTGKDLDNPSCWSSSVWTPTDLSFVAAVTLDGWGSKPPCFSFIELCNGPSVCIYVRIVDSCAGCASGSKHVDLTKSAFQSLASLLEGILTVQMRLATEPSDWFLDLWGPKEKVNN